MSFETFRKSFYYGQRSDMQAKFLASLTDEQAAGVLAEILERLGDAFDTGDLGPVHEKVYAAQVTAYSEDDAPTVPDAPFTPWKGALQDRRLALVSAGGVFRVDDDPMGANGPTQQESLALITDFLRSAPTLSVIPRDTADDQLTARHPGYDARTAQRDPNTVFPLSVLRELEDRGAGPAGGRALQLHRRDVAGAAARARRTAVGAALPDRGRGRLPAGGHLTGVPRVGRTRQQGARGRRDPHGLGVHPCVRARRSPAAGAAGARHAAPHGTHDRSCR